jgi:glycosyltransferase involved in cell wall biosynthesis
MTRVSCGDGFRRHSSLYNPLRGVGVVLKTFSVCIVAPGELFGGVETQILDLVRVLSEQRESTLSVALFHDLELAGQLRELGCNPVILSARHPYDPAPVKGLTRLIDGGRADVLHLHGYRATISAALCRSSHGYSIIKTVHGLTEPGSNLFNRTKSRLFRQLDDKATRHTRAHVCYVTADIMGRCDQAHRSLDRRVIHNGIAPLSPEGRSRPAELTPSAFNVGIVGRVTEVKGIAHALRAMAQVGVQSRLQLHVLGTGPLRDELAGESARLGLSERVHFHGFQRNILDWIAHLDALLMPSLHEGLPYTLLEAMSLGVPTVASRVGGLAEVLVDGRTGLLIEVGDEAGLAAALTRLAEDPELARRLGAASATVQREAYTLSRMADEYLEVYAQARTQVR